MEFELGQTYSGYQFLEHLESCHNAVSYRVHNTFAQRQELLKVVAPFARDDRETAEAFLREARILARVSHPHIVGFYTAQPIDGRMAMTIEWSESETLAARLGKGPLPLRDALNAACQLLSALSCLHGQNVVHLNITPSSVLRGPAGDWKLANFAMARVVNGVPITGNGAVSGHPKYISPEQVKGATLDSRSDLYSFAVVLYEMLCGRTPFDSSSQFELMLAHVNQTPDSPGRFNPSLPESLDEVLLKALAKDPADRYASAADFGWAVAGILASQPVEVTVPEREPATLVEETSVAVIEAAPDTTPEMDRLWEELILGGAVAEHLAAPESEFEPVEEAVPAESPAEIAVAPLSVPVTVETATVPEFEPEEEAVLAESATEIAGAPLSVPVTVETAAVPEFEPVLEEAALAGRPAGFAAASLSVPVTVETAAVPEFEPVEEVTPAESPAGIAAASLGVAVTVEVVAEPPAEIAVSPSPSDTVPESASAWVSMVSVEAPTEPAVSVAVPEPEAVLEEAVPAESPVEIAASLDVSVNAESAVEPIVPDEARAEVVATLLENPSAAPDLAVEESPGEPAAPESAFVVEEMILAETSPVTPSSTEEVRAAEASAVPAEIAKPQTTAPEPDAEALTATEPAGLRFAEWNLPTPAPQLQGVAAAAMETPMAPAVPEPSTRRIDGLMPEPSAVVTTLPLFEALNLEPAASEALLDAVPDPVSEDAELQANLWAAANIVAEAVVTPTGPAPEPVTVIAIPEPSRSEPAPASPAGSPAADPDYQIPPALIASARQTPDAVHWIMFGSSAAFLGIVLIAIFFSLR
jgi:serine/threonine-protein kinase